MPKKRRKLRKPYLTALDSQKVGKNEKMFGVLKLAFFFISVVFVAVFVISKINS